MSTSRRQFLRSLALAAPSVAASQQALGAVAGGNGSRGDRGTQASCLVDTTLCIGCLSCEEACRARNGLPHLPGPVEPHRLTQRSRRPSVHSLTVVNTYAGAPSPVQPEREATHVKVQCMHCLDPACVSACIVGALRRTPDGVVRYNPEICLGCRYCMVACPFQIPAYEYRDPLTPRVAKCQYCAQTTPGRPACAEICPTEAIVFGDRPALLDLARHKVERGPDRYLPHVYGEHEVGGTAWLYLLGRPAAELDLPPLPPRSPARLTEAIQHGIFRFGAIPLLLYVGLGALLWRNHRKSEGEGETDP